MSRWLSFPLYPNDWLSSPKITMMSPAEEGAYIRLLCYEWNDPDCSLPADPHQLASLSRLNEGWLKGGSQKIEKCFVPHPNKPDRIINIRLFEERKKREEWARKSKEGGKKSGELRRSKYRRVVEPPLKRNPGGARRVVEPKGNLSLSSSLSLNTKIPPIVPPQGGVSLSSPKSQNGFLEFRQAWPQGKWRGTGAAEKSYINALKSASHATLMAGLHKALRSEQWHKDNGQYIPMPATWLNQKRWDDEYPEWKDPEAWKYGD